MPQATLVINSQAHSRAHEERLVTKEQLQARVREAFTTINRWKPVFPDLTVITSNHETPERVVTTIRCNVPSKNAWLSMTFDMPHDWWNPSLF